MFDMSNIVKYFYNLKGSLTQKMKILWLFALMFFPTPKTFVHLQNTLRYFWWNPSAFHPCIDSNTTDTFKAQKGSKDIDIIVHVTSLVQT